MATEVNGKRGAKSLVKGNGDEGKEGERDRRLRTQRRIDRKKGPKVRGRIAGAGEREEREENRGEMTGLQSHSQLYKKKN